MIKEYAPSSVPDCSGWVRPEPVTINLRYVARAEKLSDGNTIIWMAGCSEAIFLGEDFERFMRDWRSVKW